MQTYVFLDLDDTLFQTERKCPSPDGLRCAARLRDGKASSYTTPRQRAMLKWMQNATVIPVTARNHDAFTRVEIVFDSFAVLNFGAVVLDADGKLDREWDERTRPKALGATARLEQTLRLMETFVSVEDLDVRVRLVHDFGMPLYLVAKHRRHDPAPLDVIVEELFPRIDLAPYFVHHNDNNLSLVPRYLGKEHAVRWIIEHRLGPAPFLTVGVADSRTDIPYLMECDLGVFPSNSQIAELLYTNRPSN